MKASIVIHNPTWFTELSQLGLAIHGKEGHEASFHVPDFGHPSMHDIARAARESGIPCTLEAAEARSLRRRLGLAAVALARRTIGRSGESELFGFLEARQSLRAAMADARALVRSRRPDVAVLGGDMAGYTTSAWIRGFHDEGVPSVLVPSTMSNGLEQAEVYGGDPRHHVSRRASRWVAERYPKWAMTHRGMHLLCSRPGRALAMETLGIAPPKPWVFNSGFADAIAMESAAMVDYYVAAGLPRENMVLTGSPSDDAMAKAVADAPRLREALYAELGLPTGRPMLLVALVPDFLYVAGGRPQCDFRDYGSLAEFFIGSLAEQQTFNVVVALHPSVKPESVRHLERPGVRIAARRTAQLVPLCDVYVASISSTIRWAIACGKPVINYDVYRYRYTDYLGVPGVLATEEKAGYRDLVRRLSTDAGYLAEVRRQQESAAPHWGRLDGGSTRRIVDLLERLGRRERG